MVAFSDVTVFEGGLGFGWMALSPDETKLALTDILGMLQIIPLDGSEAQEVAQWGFVSNWSPDGRRLYYQQSQNWLTNPVDIRVYDLDTGMDTKLVSSPLQAPDGTVIDIPTGNFIVSPLENAAVFHQFQGLWLVTWF